MKGLPGITRKRTPVSRSGNPHASERGASFSNPLAGSGKQQTSSHVSRSTAKAPGKDRGGKLIEGQELRGYVRNAPASRFNAKDATVAPDGTKRVKEL